MISLIDNISKKMNTIEKIYKKLLEMYGPQGWWPLIEINGTNPTKTGSINGYHQNDYSYPRTKNQQFEIILGVILTQNTSWPQVEIALKNLKKNNLLSPEKITEKNINLIKKSIKPAGYYNQKSERIITVSKYFKSLKKTPSRDEILSIKGIGPESADSIMLYAFKIPEFIIDAYTKRIMKALGLISENAKYDKIKEIFERSIKKDTKIYQEYHALLVEHAKHYYKKGSDFKKDPLLKLLTF